MMINEYPGSPNSERTYKAASEYTLWDIGLKPEDMRLFHFLAEYEFLYLKNIDNLFPPVGRSFQFFDRLCFLEQGNQIYFCNNAVLLDDAGVKLCKDRGAKKLDFRIIESFGSMLIQPTVISKIASEFVRESFSVSKYDASKYMFLQKKVVMRSPYELRRHSSAIGLVIGETIRAGVFYYSPLEVIPREHAQAMTLHKAGINVMIFLTEDYLYSKEIETSLGKTQAYYIPRNHNGYEMIKNIISPQTQTNLTEKQYGSGIMLPYSD